MAIEFKITDGIKDNTIIIYQSKTNTLTTLALFIFFNLIGLSGFYLNHHYFGDSYICNFICGFLCIGGWLLFKDKQNKTLTKEELKKYIDKL